MRTHTKQLEKHFKYFLTLSFPHILGFQKNAHYRIYKSIFTVRLPGNIDFTEQYLNGIRISSSQNTLI